MRITPPRRPLLLALLLLGCLAALWGCTPAKRKWEDFTQYLQDEVVRW